MQCPSCQTVNREGRRFCSKCGAPLAFVCASCGFTNDPEDEFCGGCGATLGSSRATPQSKFISPQSYTPKHLAEKILTSKAALEGERKQTSPRGWSRSPISLGPAEAELAEVRA